MDEKLKRVVGVANAGDEAEGGEGGSEGGDAAGGDEPPEAGRGPPPR